MNELLCDVAHAPLISIKHVDAGVERALDGVHIKCLDVRVAEVDVLEVHSLLNIHRKMTASLPVLSLSFSVSA